MSSNEKLYTQKNTEQLFLVMLHQQLYSLDLRLISVVIVILFLDLGMQPYCYGIGMAEDGELSAIRSTLSITPHPELH